MAISPQHQHHVRGDAGGQLAVAKEKGTKSNEQLESAEADDDEDVICGECTEERVASSVFDPLQPTARQIREHDLTHLPYRNWCPWCVKAKAREDSHSRITGEVEGLPVVGMYYAYYGNDEPR